MLKFKPFSPAMFLTLVQLKGPPLRWAKIPFQLRIPLVNDAIARFEKALLSLPFPLEPLECLFLHACHLTSAQLTSVLEKTSHLQALCLRCLHNLDSFAYLAPGEHSLQCMQVLHSMNVKPSAVEMHRLLELKASHLADDSLFLH